MLSSGGFANKQDIVSRFENIANSEPQKLREEIEAQLPKLAKHEIDELTKIIRQYYVKTYKHRATPKYGRLNKGLDDYQVQSFFRAIDRPKYGLLFGLMKALDIKSADILGI
ncbi:MAG: hypothetical protein KGH67_04620 [Candidatus Micrarchaeota archaeon]|nr:hypothetical protein [Candidatus Micrarchaeota archaeon]MDE1859785.1 hypothetical protein [Candidatus Micrarchaeota archaeon]